MKDNKITVEDAKKIDERMNNDKTVVKNVNLGYFLSKIGNNTAQKKISKKQHKKPPNS